MPSGCRSQKGTISFGSNSGGFGSIRDDILWARNKWDSAIAANGGAPSRILQGAPSKTIVTEWVGRAMGGHRSAFWNNFLLRA
jgi:hypothetical protein